MVVQIEKGARANAQNNVEQLEFQGSKKESVGEGKKGIEYLQNKPIVEISEGYEAVAKTKVTTRVTEALKNSDIVQPTKPRRWWQKAADWVKEKTSFASYMMTRVGSLVSLGSLSAILFRPMIATELLQVATLAAFTALIGYALGDNLFAKVKEVFVNAQAGEGPTYDHLLSAEEIDYDDSVKHWREYFTTANGITKAMTGAGVAATFLALPIWAVTTANAALVAAVVGGVMAVGGLLGGFVVNADKLDAAIQKAEEETGRFF